MAFLSEGSAFTVNLKFLECRRRNDHAEETSKGEILDVHGLHGG